MLTQIEEYVISCIKNNKKVGGRKVSGHNIDYKKLYCIALNLTPPKCSSCSEKECTFYSVALGFGKYCSLTCSCDQLSIKNKTYNAERNKQRKIDLDSKYESVLKIISNEYLSDKTKTIQYFSEIYGVPSGRITKHLKENGVFDPKRRHNIQKENWYRKFEDKIDKLKDSDWVNRKISENWNSKDFANYLGCSPNFVCVGVKKYSGISLPNTIIVSSQENKVYDFLKEENIFVKRNDRNIIKPKEIDLYLPDYNIAIEINGLYWHSKHDKKYHLQKTIECNNLGISLLHFYDTEIENNFELVKSIIRSKIGKVNRIYARECVLKEIPSELYRNFLNENHIQKQINSKIKIGLYFKDELVSVMGFSKPRFNKNYDYELIRFCNKSGISVVGGASRLFKHFIKTHTPNTIISYSQKRLFDGKTYTKLGMEYKRSSVPNYLWVNKYNDIKTRYQTQKHKIGGNEIETMTKLGYFKVYDCGQDVFVWDKISQVK